MDGEGKERELQRECEGVIAAQVLTCSVMPRPGCVVREDQCCLDTSRVMSRVTQWADDSCHIQLNYEVAAAEFQGAWLDDKAST